MAAKYIALLTQVGAAKLANATALGKILNITHMGVGDGGGNPTTPDLTQTALINEKRRAALNGLRVDPNNPNQIIAEQIIPENEGGFWLREIGLYDADGDLIAVANCPETYKPQMQEGSGRVQTVRMILAVSQTDAVSLKIDPAVVLASRQYVDDKALSSLAYTDTKVTEVKSYTDNGLAAHIAAVNPHKQYAPIESPAFTGNPTAPTPPLFDADSSIATTAFVHAAIGNLSGVRQITSAGNITVDDAGRFVMLDGTPGTVFLPSALAVPAGTTLHISSRQSGWVISSSNNQPIDTTYSLITSFRVGQAENVVLVSNGINSWTMAGGVVQMRYAESFRCLSATNGYQVLPSGVIFQWGMLAMAPSVANVYRTQSFAFPIAFPNALFSISGAIRTGISAESFVNSSFEGASNVGATWYYSSGLPVSGCIISYLAVGF
ncbi:phage tail protein [Dickeya zeae]|uniref:Phage tail protein n=1 Tax=Dickeya zeae TaxID=204042 RepID=A0AAE7CX77_9GAMM|nr:phage tail protein [Dickeya zeae]QIZ49447.1 phage tail protein [Dickeya zeae]